MVVFKGFTSVWALKSCAIDTDLGTTVGLVTRLSRDGVAGVDFGRAGVCSNDPEMCDGHSLSAQEIG